MNELTKKVIDDLAAAMDKAVIHTEIEFSKIRAGKAMPGMVDSLHAEMYGAEMQLTALASITAPDARTILITPFDKTSIHAIEKAIVEANIGLNPQNDGVVVRITIPPMTEERRKLLVKNIKAEGEAGKVAIRNLRKEANEKAKKLKADSISEDEIKDAEAKIQVITDKHIEKVDQLLSSKEKEIMTV
ncbi:MAG: ribosome recycling factor [Bacteroidetes bacterium]|nr:ribosome recycling factor [Bacteroidota bacterium]